MASYKSNVRKAKRNYDSVVEGVMPKKCDSKNKKQEKMNNILKNKQRGYK